MAARRAVAQLPARAVHLRITPRPSSLSESREIFRLLQGFGDISTYKHLRYEYHNPAANIAVAIYRTPGSAQRALDASPIRFALETAIHTDEPALHEQPGADEAIDAPPISTQDDIDSIGDMLRPSSLLTSTVTTSAKDPNASASSERVPLPFEAPQATTATAEKWFHVVVDRSRVVHQDFVERQPLWKQFSPMRSMAQEDLAKVVPHRGLSDVSKRPPNAHRTPNKILKNMNEYVETRMPSLRQMWEEAEAQRGSV